MISTTATIKGKLVFIDRAETDAEDGWLATLASQSRYFAKTCRKTGLHVEHESVCRGRRVIALSLQKPASFGDEEKALLASACESIG